MASQGLNMVGIYGVLQFLRRFHHQTQDLYPIQDKYNTLPPTLINSINYKDPNKLLEELLKHDYHFVASLAKYLFEKSPSPILSPSLVYKGILSYSNSRARPALKRLSYYQIWFGLIQQSEFRYFFALLDTLSRLSAHPPYILASTFAPLVLPYPRVDTYLVHELRHRSLAIESLQYLIIHFSDILNKVQQPTQTISSFPATTLNFDEAQKLINQFLSTPVEIPLSSTMFHIPKNLAESIAPVPLVNSNMNSLHIKSNDFNIEPVVDQNDDVKQLKPEKSTSVYNPNNANKDMQNNLETPKRNIISEITPDGSNDDKLNNEDHENKIDFSKIYPPLQSPQPHQSTVNINTNNSSNQSMSSIICDDKNHHDRLSGDIDNTQEKTKSSENRQTIIIKDQHDENINSESTNQLTELNSHNEIEPDENITEASSFLLKVGTSLHRSDISDEFSPIPIPVPLLPQNNAYHITNINDNNLITDKNSINNNESEGSIIIKNKDKNCGAIISCYDVNKLSLYHNNFILKTNKDLDIIQLDIINVNLPHQTNDDSTNMINSQSQNDENYNHKDRSNSLPVTVIEKLSDKINTPPPSLPKKPEKPISMTITQIQPNHPQMSATVKSPALPTKPPPIPPPIPPRPLHLPQNISSTSVPRPLPPKLPPKPPTLPPKPS